MNRYEEKPYQIYLGNEEIGDDAISEEFLWNLIKTYSMAF